MLTLEVKKYIDRSVLCWLATSNDKNEPNVSPKEMFAYEGDSTFLMANLATPNSIENINTNPNVCVSFVEIFVQKGFKLKGFATIIEQSNPLFNEKVKPIIDLFGDSFPIQSIIEIDIQSVDRNQAPSYFLYPEYLEAFQIKSAMKTY